jgi:hypothetical protein
MLTVAKLEKSNIYVLDSGLKVVAPESCTLLCI